MPATDARREILEKVAAGEMTPDRAAEELASLGRLPSAEGPTATSHETDISSLRVIGRFRAVKIEGDPGVTGASVQGPHKASTHGGVMTIEDEDPDPDEPGYVLFGGPGNWERRRRINIEAKFNGREFRIGEGSQPPALHIKMNPALALDVEITAGSVKVSNVVGQIRANLTAGSARFEGVRSPVDIGVEAGSILVKGLFDRGGSEIRCSAGKIKVELDRGSDVKVRARATLGKVQIPGSDEPERRRQGIGAEKELVVGAGTSRLDLEATTGTVVVDVAK